MTQEATLSRLATLLGTITPNPPARVITNRAEAVNLADFPLAVVYVPENQPFSTTTDAHGWTSHSYTVEVALLVGSLGVTPLPELQGRAQGWPDKLLSVLTPDRIKDSGSFVLFAGGEQDKLEIKYRIGQVQWGDGNDYYGIVASVPLMERIAWG